MTTTAEHDVIAAACAWVAAEEWFAHENERSTGNLTAVIRASNVLRDKRTALTAAVRAYRATITFDGPGAVLADADQRLKDAG